MSTSTQSLLQLTGVTNLALSLLVSHGNSIKIVIMIDIAMACKVVMT